MFWPFKSVYLEYHSISTKNSSIIFKWLILMYHKFKKIVIRFCHFSFSFSFFYCFKNKDCYI